MRDLVKKQLNNRWLSDNDSGFSIVEMMIAMCIMSIGILAVASMQNTAMTTSSRGNIITMASLLAAQRVEELKNIQDVDDLDNEDGDVSADTKYGTFTIRTTVARTGYDTASDLDSRLITVNVTWGGPGGWVSDKGVTLQTISLGNGQI